MNDNRRLMKGNEAFAEASIVAGCRYYFGYPITPQNEIIEYMSRELSGAGGEFIQAESEIAAISMGIGATAAGGKVMITSSSPGVALMQEGLSFLCSADLPLVLLNVSRGGPGVGGIQPGQADYFQATRGGGNGDYHLIVYAPATIQESIDTIQKAFSIAEEYSNPVMLLVDGMLGQMMEPVLMPGRTTEHTNSDTEAAKPWALTGHGDVRDVNVVRSLRLKPNELENSITSRRDKYQKAERELTEYELKNIEDAEVVFVAFGTTSRIIQDAMDLLKDQGLNVGLIRPKTLWPFPYKAFDEISDKTKVVISVELSEGQLIQDVKLGVNGRYPVSLINRTGGMLLSPEEIAERTMVILGEVR